MRNIRLIVLILCGLAMTPCLAQLQFVSARAQRESDRSSIMVMARNAGNTPITITDLRLDGKAIAEHMVQDPKNRNYGIGVDWCEARPRTVPPGGATMIMLGSVIRPLREPHLKLVAVTDQGEFDLTCPTPQLETLRIACAAFNQERNRLTLYVRNDGTAPANLQRIVFSHRPASADITGSPVPPGMLGTVTLTFAEPLPFGQDCSCFLTADTGTATAWFRAHPAGAYTYGFWAHHADSRDLAEKNVDVGSTVNEPHPYWVTDLYNAKDGNYPEAMVKRALGQIKAVIDDPKSWAWYMQDDAGWGRPHPQKLIELSQFLRNNGSMHIQALCNPADNERYAWLMEQMVNYSYLVTHQGSDPAYFSGGRSIDLMLMLNEPAPLAYLVDSVGQGVRWITPAEEEVHSYAMLGRGSKHNGWFMIPSVWEQGSGWGGGIDGCATRPMRYQEGATANTPLWRHIGNIAGFFTAMAPYIASSARLPGHLRPDRVEVLPILCKDDVVMTTVLNRHLRCLYPRDFPEGGNYGGVKLQPYRNFVITHPLPSWIKPAKVLAFDHDRGLRDLSFQALDGSIRIRIDALDTATTLLICPSEEVVREVTVRIKEKVKPSVAGSPLRPDVVQQPGDAPKRAWDMPAADLRFPVQITGPVAAGAWVKTSLPLDELGPYGPLGYLEPGSVRAFANGKAVPSKLDFARLAFDPAQGVDAWAYTGDANSTRFRTVDGVLQISSQLPEGKYHRLTLKQPLDPAYDVLETDTLILGNSAYMFSYAVTIDGKKQSRVSRLYTHPGSVEQGKQVTGYARNNLRQLVREREEAILQDNQKKGKNDPADPNAEPVDISLACQVYNGDYHFGKVRQTKSRPDVYLQAPAAVPAGQALTAYVYLRYQATPSADGDYLAAEERPQAAATAACGALEPFRIATLRHKLSKDSLMQLAVTTDSQAHSVWVEARNADGTLVAEQRLDSKDNRAWTLAKPLSLPADAARVEVIAAGMSGWVIASPLRTPAPRQKLPVIATVSGQVETMACPADASWVMVGADKVYAIAPNGTVKWDHHLGEYRRQQERFGPGRNIEQVGVNAEGTTAFARTFRFEKGSYQPGVLALFAPATGKPLGKLECFWDTPATFRADGTIEVDQQGADKKMTPVSVHPTTAAVTPLDPKQLNRRILETNGKYSTRIISGPVTPLPNRVGIFEDAKQVSVIDLPPYTLHRHLFADGRLLVATTQGLLQMYGLDGQVLWSVRRPYRIDDMCVFAGRNEVALAYKTYPNRWDWHCVPVLEILSTHDGSSITLREGQSADDLGNLGTDLQLAASQDGARIYLGDQTGRIYLLQR
jgi:hypothetical protein